jgi:hypothetical protein
MSNHATSAEQFQTLMLNHATSIRVWNCSSDVA